jgi:hypothetical protein
MIVKMQTFFNNRQAAFWKQCIISVMTFRKLGMLQKYFLDAYCFPMWRLFKTSRSIRIEARWPRGQCAWRAIAQAKQT